MKAYRKLCAAWIVFFALMAVGVNFALTQILDIGQARTYMVEINRAEDEIQCEGRADLDGYTTLVNISKLEENAGENEKASFFEPDSDYAVRLIDGAYYRFDYEPEERENASSIRLAVNLSMAAAALAAAILMFRLWRNILLPFHKIAGLPEQIARGNLTGDIRESKNKYFGKFIWGLNILKESLEGSRARDKPTLKEKQTLILSLSHDIKTPLSAIRLYAKALEKDLYRGDEEKKSEIARKISRNTDEINTYLKDIVKANDEDFLNLEVQSGEFYLSELLREIREYYREKLRLLGTEYEVGGYRDCLLKGDIDRAVEVLQNILENAIKYGDGEKITISVAQEDDLRLVTVDNTGIPPGADEMAHIFSSFYRGSNTGGRPGSGLGLYICRRLMTMMDGEIRAKRLENGMRVTVGFRMQ